MSVLGYFKAAIQNWKHLKKKTPTRIKEMKEIFNQFELSKWAEDFKDEDSKEVLLIQRQLKEIYNEIFK